MHLNFSLYGSQVTYGWLPESATLIGGLDFVKEAVRRGFRGAEIPTRCLERATGSDLSAIRALADEHQLELVLSAFGTDVDYLTAMTQHAVTLGAGVVRTVVGGADYGGDRRAYAGGLWQPFMHGVRERLGKVLRTSERIGVSLAVENHQDVASEDLLWLCESFDSPWFGVVLDAANPLATGEHPITFARKMLPWIKYLHMKDYTMHWSDEGYRLAEEHSYYETDIPRLKRGRVGAVLFGIYAEPQRTRQPYGCRGRSIVSMDCARRSGPTRAIWNWLPRPPTSCASTKLERSRQWRAWRAATSSATASGSCGCSIPSACAR